MALADPVYDDDADRRWRPEVIEGGGEGDGTRQGDLRDAPNDTPPRAIGRSALKSLESGSQGDGEPRGNLRSVDKAGETEGENRAQKSLDQPELANREEGAGETGHGPAAGAFSFNAADVSGWARAKNMFWGSRRRKQATIGGGVTGAAITAVLVLAGIASGPLQLIHLGEVLAHNFSKIESDSSDRNGHLFRYSKAWKNKNVGYTRLGAIGVKVMNSAVDKLAEAGFTIEGTNTSNRPTDIGIDRTKVEKNFPETKNMSDEKFRSFLEDKFSVPADQFKPVATTEGKVTKYNLDVREFKFSSINKLVKNGQIGLVGNGKIVAGLKTRAVGKFFGLGSLFHPFSRALSQKLNSRVTAANEKRQSAKQAEKQFAQEEINARTSSIDAKGDVVAKEVKEKVDKQNGWRTKGIIFAGVVLAAACTAHEVAGEIPKIDYYRVVAPSEIQSASILAQASATKTNSSDTTLNQVGAAVQNLTNDQGKTVWQSASLQAMQGESPVTDSKGNVENDLPLEYRQAYEQHTTAGTVKTVSTDVLDGLTGPAGVLSLVGIHPGLVLCNGFVQYGLLVGSAIVQGVAAFFSGGTSQVAITAADTAETLVVQKYVIGSVIKWVEGWFINSSTGGKLAKDAFSGPLGGNLLAFGARSTANLAAIGSGGVSLGDKSTNSTFISEADREDQAQFRSESMFARLFDAQDYRSLTGHLADEISPSFAGNVSSMVDSFLSMGSRFSTIFSSLMPHTAAATNSNSWSGGFNWGFPQYGLPDSLLNDPDLDDPYQNANNVGQHLSQVCVDADGNIGADKGACASGDYGGIKARVMACFGNTLSYTDGQPQGTWDVSPAANVEINTNDSPYIDDSCGDTGNQDWRRIIMFINDTGTMKSVDCYMGDTDTSQQSCADEGLGSGEATSSAGSSAGVGGYQNPLRDAKLTPHRVDEGVDYAGAGPVYALGDGKVLGLGEKSDWPNHVFIVYQLTSGSASGKYVYVAEDCTPAVSAGQTVTSSTVLCNMFDGPDGIETGWAADPSSGTIALAHDVYSEGHSTALGVNFDQLMQKLGAPAGTYDFPGETPEGSLPSGWPQW